jgi:hypothetical protein
MPDPTKPLSLSDVQLDAILRASAPLLPQNRGPFLREVAATLATLPDELGDGLVHRIITTIQHKHFDPPKGYVTAAPKHSSKRRGY